MNHPRSPRAALVVWLVGAGAALAALLALGADRPGTPPLTRPSQWASWAADREVLDVVASCARVLAIAALGHLLVVTLAQLGVSLRGERSGRRGRWLGRVAPRFIGALTAAAVASASPAGADEAASSAGADRSLPAAATSGSAIQPGMGATMHLVVPGEETSLPWADDLEPASEADPSRSPEVGGEPQGDPASAPAAAGEWVVRPGDHLWGIAEEVLAEREGGEPSEATVRALWVRLIEANRDRLVDPEDPDLILPGQRLVLPPAPPRG